MDTLNLSLALLGLALALIAMWWARLDERAARDLNHQTNLTLQSIKSTSDAIRESTDALEKGIQDHVADNNRRLWSWITDREKSAASTSSEESIVKTSTHEASQFVFWLLQRHIEHRLSDVTKTDLALLEHTGLLTPEQFDTLVMALQDAQHQPPRSEDNTDSHDNRAQEP